MSVARLGGGIVSPVRAGENAGRTLHHEFIALIGLLTVPLVNGGRAELLVVPPCRRPRASPAKGGGGVGDPPRVQHGAGAGGRRLAGLGGDDQ